jgi:hypothetical protein
MSEYMSYVNRSSIAANTNQMLTSYDWDITIETGTDFKVYYPGDLTFKTRLMDISGINPLYSTDAPLDVMIRGFKIHQNSFTSNVPGTITLHLQDFEDQSITGMLLDWIIKYNDPATHISFNKSAVMWKSFTAYRLNNTRQPVYSIKIYNLLPSQGTGNDYDQFTGEKAKLGDIRLSLEAEYYEVKLLNISGAQ